MNDKELYHYGVKGMKWGVRKRYLNENGSLNDRGIKKYAKKAYAKEAYNSNKTVLGKAYDKFTSAHKYQADYKYASKSKKANREAAEKYLKTKQRQKNKPAHQKALQTGAKITGKAGKAAASIG